MVFVSDLVSLCSSKHGTTNIIFLVYIKSAGLLFLSVGRLGSAEDWPSMLKS